jgi:hypothetical protein
LAKLSRPDTIGKKFTALFTVRRWLRETPCTAAQASVLFAMASFAQPDGTGVHPGVDDLAELTKLDRKTVIGALKVWRAAGTVTRTKNGNRRMRQADEHKINLDWEPAKVAVDHFYKSGPESPMQSSKVASSRPKVASKPPKVALGHPSEEEVIEKAIIEKAEEEPAASAEDIHYSFWVINAEPYGPEPFRSIWAEELERAWAAHTYVNGELPRFADAMERTIRRTEALGLRVPSAFFLAKREIEKKESEYRQRFRPN